MVISTIIFLCDVAKRLAGYRLLFKRVRDLVEYFFGLVALDVLLHLFDGVVVLGNLDQADFFGIAFVSCNQCCQFLRFLLGQKNVERNQAKEMLDKVPVTFE